jgi:hypothetical protein
MTVKEYLTNTYLNITPAFWNEVQIDPNIPWQNIDISQLNRISENLGDSVCQIIDPTF